MQQSRRREFQQIRSNAALSQLSRSQATSLRSSRISQPSLSQACVNCVNQIMAERQKTAEKEIKQKQRGEFRKQQEYLNSWVDPQARYRDNMKKDALAHNSKMIDQHKFQKQHEMETDLSYATQTQKNVEDCQKMMRSQMEAEQKMKNQYYSEIHQQYLNELKKKDNQRVNRSENPESVQGLPLFNPDRTQQRLEYRKELQRQMQQKMQRQRQQKRNSQKAERKLLKEYENQARKYHADNYESMRMSKQEVFDGLKNLQKQKKQKAEIVKRQNEQQRIRQMRQDNQARSRAVKAKMQQMKKYVDVLKGQLLQKQDRLRCSKMEQSRFKEKYPKSTEQLNKQYQVKRNCGVCHRDYPQEYISPVPKKQ